MKLMIGAGSVRREGWLTLDADASRQPDYVATLPPMPLSLALQQWDEVEWVHGVQSLYPWEALDVLQRLRVMLSPDGLLVLEQPDARCAARRILDSDTWTWWMFGDPKWKNPLHMCRWAYTPESLADMLRAAGFTRIELMPPQHHDAARDFRMEARP